jgi:hypothetical protein
MILSRLERSGAEPLVSISRHFQSGQDLIDLALIDILPPLNAQSGVTTGDLGKEFVTMEYSLPIVIDIFKGEQKWFVMPIHLLFL